VLAKFATKIGAEEVRLADRREAALNSRRSRLDAKLLPLVAGRGREYTTASAISDCKNILLRA
jgi:hypothetical protein